MKHRLFSMVLGLSLVAMGLSAANGAVITSLYNTGQATGTHALLGNNVLDPNYDVIVSPLGAFDPRTATQAGEGFPIPPWIGDNGLSRWIGPQTGDLIGPDGLYVYRTTFDLTGFVPSSVSISGRWATDDPGQGIFLNGVLVSTVGENSTGFTAFTNFLINSSDVAAVFLPGINTLDFHVLNSNNVVGPDTGPTGLRVEMDGTANLVIPEPATMTLWAGMGLVVAGGSFRRRFLKKNV